MLTRDEAIMVAGIIEGAGRFTYSGEGRYMTLVIGSNEQALITWLHRRIGGSMQVRPASLTQRAYLTLHVQGDALKAVCDAIDPFVIAKRPYLPLVQAHLKTIARSGRAKTPTAILEERARIGDELAALGRRGIPTSVPWHKMTVTQLLRQRKNGDVPPDPTP
jgi:hypothetical protein